MIIDTMTYSSLNQERKKIVPSQLDILLELSVLTKGVDARKGGNTPTPFFKLRFQ